MSTSAARPESASTATGISLRERRKELRVRVRGLICDRGEVIDLSTKGMRLRVHRRWNEGQVRTITIVAGGNSVPVEARCVWCRQEGMFSHVVGIAFQHMQEGEVERLSTIVAISTKGAAD